MNDESEQGELLEHEEISPYPKLLLQGRHPPHEVARARVDHHLVEGLELDERVDDVSKRAA